MSKIVVFGTAAFAEAVHFYLANDSEHEVVAFTVHGSHMNQESFRGLPIVPFETVQTAFPPDDYHMYVAIGAKEVNEVRARVYQEAKAKGYTLISYVNSKCTHWGDTQIGDNCFIFEDNTIQPFVTIGNNVVLWSGNHIGHSVTIGDHCFITSHVVISGHVQIGEKCFVGVNATFRDSIAVGRSCVIGAGALIMKSTKDREVYVPERTTPRPFTSERTRL